EFSLSVIRVLSSNLDTFLRGLCSMFHSGALGYENSKQIMTATKIIMTTECKKPEG
ncbi:12867_t:CDS:2, partial [Ambispora leptoticha]